jgi:hypothetical protein
MSFLIQQGQDGIILAKEIISEVNNRVRRIYWTNDEIDKYFAKRSATEILRNGFTGFMNPCLDLTLVSASMMTSRDVPYFFVIEEHLPVPNFNFNRLHFALEFQSRDKNYFLNYKKDNEAHIGEGKYEGRKDLPLSQIKRISREKINPDKPIYQNFGYETLNEFLENEFCDYSLESNLYRLKLDNSTENFNKHKRECGEDFKIILKH